MTRTLLDGRVAVVSGVGPGLGRAVALAFAAQGADVALGARREETCRQIAEEVEALGRRSQWRSTDVTDPDACRALADATAERFGGIDILVNNAFTSGRPLAPVEEADLGHWRSVMDVNYWGSLNMTRAVIPAMKERGGGRIVMINAMAMRRIRPTWGAYVASKSALAGIVKVLALELGPSGIRVNGVHPGYIYADAVKAHFERLAEERGIDAQQVYEEVAAETALKYLPGPEQIAGTVVFFASDLSLPVTGQSLEVNAGHWFH